MKMVMKKTVQRFSEVTSEKLRQQQFQTADADPVMI
jgi:hypothetical protein